MLIEDFSINDKYRCPNWLNGEGMKRQALLILMSVLLLYLVHSVSLETGYDATIENPKKSLHTIPSDKEISAEDSGVENSNGTQRKTHIFFDKAIYFPDVDVFWNKNASFITFKITVMDRNVGSKFIKVKIFSNLDVKKVTLTKVAPGKFEGTVLANCLRLDESVVNSTVFNVRYGDKIVAKYIGQIQATAIVAYPTHIMTRSKAPISLDFYKLFDSEGVPLVNYGWPIGVQYNPVTICHYALTNYHNYIITENSTFKERFLIQVNWLVKNAVQKGNFSVWECKFDLPEFKLTNPWVSAMAQGDGLSVLTRAYVLTGNTTYLAVAETAMRSFEVEMSYGGVRYTDSSGVWYEEGADAGAPSSKILNGFIFALFGLYEYSWETNSSEGYALFWEGTHTLSLNLYRYDTGFWSYYDLLHYMYAPEIYHELHVRQLMTLYWLTGDPVFQEYSDRFNSYIH